MLYAMSHAELYHYTRHAAAKDFHGAAEAI